VTVAWIEIYGSIASKIFVVQGTAKQESWKDFIVHNCSIKKQLQAGKIFTMQNFFVEKLNRMTILSKHFNSSVICDTIFFVHKNRVKSIHLSHCI
jgi:hypothetical protein